MCFSIITNKKGEIMSRKIWVKHCLLVLTVLFFGLFICSQARAYDKNMKIAALCGPVGGSGFSFMSVWAPIINSVLDINISVQSRGGNAMTARLVNSGTGDFGLSTSGLCYQGMVGEAKWAQNQKLSNLRVVAVFQPYVFQAYGLAKSGIKKLSDLNGKTVSFNRRGTSTQTWLQQWAPLLGLKPGRIFYVGPGQGDKLLADGRIAAQFTSGTMPHTATLELESNHKIFVIGFGKKNVEKILAKYPEVSAYTIKAGTYKGLDHDEYSIADALLLITNKNVPDDLIYDVLKTTFEKRKELIQGFARFKQAKIENIVHSSIPLHPGAVRFYEEHGIKIPQRLLPPK